DGLSGERRAGTKGREPGVFEAGVLDLPNDVDAPVLRLPGLIAQTLERDPHFDFVAPIGQAPVQLKHIVWTQVGLSSTDDRSADDARGGNVRPFDERAVPLHAERLDGEHEWLLAIVKCAEQDLHIVVAKDL